MLIDEQYLDDVITLLSDGIGSSFILDNNVEFRITSQLTLDLITSYNVETQLLLYIFINIHSIPKWATEAEAKA